MNKIKELALRIESALLGRKWVYDKLTGFNKYLDKALKAVEVAHMRREVYEIIASWSDVTQVQKDIIKKIIDSIIPKVDTSYTKSELSYRPRVMLNLKVAKSIVVQLGGIVGVQPMSGPISQLFFMQYKAKEAIESDLESSDNGKVLTLQVISQAVEATSKRLRASWSVEAAQDISTIHGVDIVEELEGAITEQIATEVIEEVLEDLRRLAVKIDISDLKIINSATFDPVDQESAKLLTCELVKAKNSIAHKTRRGGGNVIIVNPITLAILQTGKGSKFVSSGQPNFVGPTSGLMYVGRLTNIGMDVYVKADLGDEIIMAYKPKHNNIDVGYVYAPYVPVNQSGVVVNPLTYQPQMMLMSRYGKGINGDMEQASQYYRVIKLDSPNWP